jgi:hypothetical protein
VTISEDGFGSEARTLRRVILGLGVRWVCVVSAWIEVSIASYGCSMGMVMHGAVLAKTEVCSADC